MQTQEMLPKYTKASSLATFLPPSSFFAENEQFYSPFAGGGQFSAPSERFFSEA
jgi:hypothetical protein